eukprot:1146000-Pelagomonas_calceolata.AAC.1
MAAIRTRARINMNDLEGVLRDEIIHAWKSLDNLTPQEASSRIMRTYKTHFGVPLVSIPGWWHEKSETKSVCHFSTYDKAPFCFSQAACVGSPLLQKDFHADISLSSRNPSCWTSHLLFAMNGLWRAMSWRDYRGYFTAEDIQARQCN